ncbi:MAG: exo-alpha-sialidase [Nitrosomonadales bacterium]|nr:exo-alpha-sialidase [Nitrosomonadales bacterium]
MLKSIGRQSNIRRPLILCMVLATFGAAFYKVVNRPPSALFQPSVIISQPINTAPGIPNALSGIHSHFVSTQQNIHTHAASLVELSDGRLRAFWFQGSSEGAQDVEIFSAVFDPEKNHWGMESSIANREDTQRSLLRYVKKLGNPVARRAADGTLWLFYVTVSLGGWAGSSITAITSKDDGTTWSPARRLITSPFLNISTLVKGTPFFYGDGSMGLPVYHEFIGKFGELLRISGSGEIIDKQRLSSGNVTLQPVVLIKNPQQSIVMMRYSGASPRRVIATSTEDAGQHWSVPAKTTLANPDAAVSGVVLPDGRILLALNDTEAGRGALSLAISSDNGATWKTVYQLEDQRGQNTDPSQYVQLAAESAKATEPGITDAAPYAESAKRNKCTAQSCGFEFSYPYLIQTRSGDFHLVYTWNRSYIKHVWFTRAWLDQSLEKTSDAKLY